MPIISDNQFPKVYLTEQSSSPATPSSGLVRLYAKSDGQLYYKDDTGAEKGPLLSPDVLPWQFSITPMVDKPNASTGSWFVSSHTDAASPWVGAGHNAQGLVCVNAQAEYIEWAVVLAAGTWNITLYSRLSTNTAIVTFLIDGASVGTIDTYAASAGAGEGTITGVTVATTGKKLLRLTFATKNASSSSYAMTLRAIAFRRTA